MTANPSPVIITIAPETNGDIPGAKKGREK
jgi:hypothetical protein